MERFDLLVVGGGINGVGIARDAAGRGLKVLLVEKDDLASHTSRWSTKLVHGGLRYLEHYEFRLVRESLREREVLRRAAPHLVRPLRFILPHERGQRPLWMIRAGLYLYDRLGGRGSFPRSRRLDLPGTEEGTPLKAEYTRGFSYYDAQVDDSRLVIANAIDARERGAEIKTRTKFLGAYRKGARWAADIEGFAAPVEATAIVNAAGPWVTDLFASIGAAEARKQLRLVKGSHLVTRQLYDGQHAYLFQNADKRVIFAIPWLFGTTLIGTTDEPHHGPPDTAKCTPEETAYLLASVNRYLRTSVTEADIRSSFAGVRPLYDDLSAKSASAVTRDYAFDVDDADGTAPPLLSVYGGKLTTYRKLAEHALEHLAAHLSMGPPWTEKAALPGGGVTPAEWTNFLAETRARYHFLGAETLERIIRAYGTRIDTVLDGARSSLSLGRMFAHGLSEQEISYLIDKEWARTAEDILERRTLLSMLYSDSEKQQLTASIFA